MAQITLKDATKTLDVVKMVVYMLWEGCMSAVGMGFLQNKPDATVEEVFQRAANAGDYVGKPCHPDGVIYMDYVFGRCIKTQVKYDITTGTISISPDEPRSTYQDWGKRYVTAATVLHLAVAKCSVETKEVI